MARERSGRPRQFWVMWQNIRCSILFHLLVPGGKWQTVMRSPRSSANSCSPTFHNRDRMLLLPPAIHRDQQLGSLGIEGQTHLPPPAAYRFLGKGGGVMIDTHAHPALIEGQVIDPSGNDFAQLLVGKS